MSLIIIIATLVGLITYYGFTYPKFGKIVLGTIATIIVTTALIPAVFFILFIGVCNPGLLAQGALCIVFIVAVIAGISIMIIKLKKSKK